MDCVVGVYPHERNRPQLLSVDMEMAIDTEQAAIGEKLGLTVDYASISAQVVFLLQSCRFELLETAAHVIARYLLAPPAAGERRTAVDSLKLTLTKPGALDGRATPKLTIVRDASWVTLTHEEKPFGTVDIIHETKDAGIYRLNVAPGKGIPLHIHRKMRESEMVLGDGLLCQGKPVWPGTVHRWPRGAAHRYDNPTDRYQTVLCVDSPPFIPADEIEVQGEPTEILSEPPLFGEPNYGLTRGQG